MGSSELAVEPVKPQGRIDIVMPAMEPKDKIHRLAGVKILRDHQQDGTIIIMPCLRLQDTIPIQMTIVSGRIRKTIVGRVEPKLPDLPLLRPEAR